MAIRQDVEKYLQKLTSALVANSIVVSLPSLADSQVGTLDIESVQSLLEQIESGLKVFLKNLDRRHLSDIRRVITGGAPPAATVIAQLVSNDEHVLFVQKRCYAMARRFFGSTDAVRLATAASELARNIYMYAQTGEIRLELHEGDGFVTFIIIAKDKGPGIPNIQDILSGKYVSKTGLGRGLAGTKRLLDEFEVETAPGQGTFVRGAKKARLV